MSKNLRHLLIILTIAIVTAPSLFGQQALSPNEIDQLKEKVLKSTLTKLSKDDIQISDTVYNQSLKGYHVYLHQFYKGIKIDNTQINIFLREGKSSILSSNFIQIPVSEFASFPNTNPSSGLNAALRHFGISTQLQSAQRQSGDKTYFKALAANRNEAMLEKVWVLENEQLIPCWKSTLDLPSPQNTMYEIFTKADNGEVIKTTKLTIECQFDEVSNSAHLKHDDHIGHLILEDDQYESLANTYTVFDLPLEAPTFGSRTTTSSPWDRPGIGNFATTLGWHNDNSINYNITRGNNVFAYEDKDNNINTVGYSPDGGVGHDFNYYHSAFKHPDSLRGAGLTNLFHTNNLTHDILYQYGFDEISGNFQNHNLGRGGSGVDYVLAEGLDGGGTNNANFSTPADGSRPRMQMYTWSTKLECEILEPIANQQNVVAVESAFSINNKLISKDEVVGFVALAQDTLGCSVLTNPGDISGKIALIYRGTCPFIDKLMNAQNAGAIGVIIVNNVANAPFSMAGSKDSITIPAIMVSLSDGNLIKSLISQNVKISMRVRAPDGNYDNGIIIHEFGHGVSNRLIDGPSAVGCLQNKEQMGEGWSDFLALMLITDWSSALESHNRGIGTYAINEAISADGIRTYPYSTDMMVNPFTYGDVASAPLSNLGQPSPHFIGSIWATMLWDMTWKIIEMEGLDSDIYHGVGGNNIALQLVMDAFKLTACSPGFVDGRDAILLADELRYGGVHKCAIWQAFARRGLGFSAIQGNTNIHTDGIEAFDLPQESIEENVVISSDELTTVQITKTITNGCENKTDFHFVDQLPDGLQLDHVLVGNQIDDDEISSATSSLAPLETLEIQYKAALKPCKGTGNALTDAAEGSNAFTNVNLIAGSHTWVKSTNHAVSPDMSWYAENKDVTSNYALTQISNLNLPNNTILSFQQKFDTEATWDGGVVEISINGGAYIDLGAKFIENAYPSRLSSLGSSSLAGRDAFTGDSELIYGSTYFIRSSIDLGDYAGQNIKIRFRFASDDNTNAGVGLNGWYIDDIKFDFAHYIETTTYAGVILGISQSATYVIPNNFAGNTAYLDHQSAGSGNGKNWVNAHDDLSNMLLLAGCRNIETINVAEGSYKPIEDRDSSFTIPNGLSVFGGFEHISGSRDILTHPTILSGSIGSAGTADDVFHVVKIPLSSSNALLDGIRINGGNANGVGFNALGSGIFNQGSVVLKDVKLDQGHAGSVIHNESSANIELTGSTIIED